MANNNNKTNNNKMKPVIVAPVIEVKEKEERKVGKTLYIGNGAAGNKAVVMAVKRGDINIEDTLLINSTKDDFPADYTGNTVVLSNGGCGKDRDVSKRYMKAAIESGTIDRAITIQYENVVIATSLEGGTGSGSTPLLGMYCLKVLGKNVRIYGFAGFEDDPHGLENTIGFFKELDFECTVQCIRNSLFKAPSKYEAEQAANEEFCKHIRILSGMDMIPSSQNIDSTDLSKLRNTIGYCVVDKVEFDDTLMSVEDFNKVCKQMIVQTKSLRSEPSQVRLGVIMNIKPESEDAVDAKFTVLKDAYGSPYEVFTHKQYDGGSQYIAVISTGMKLPLDDAQAIYDRYLKAASSINTGKDEFIDKMKGMETNEDRFRINPDRSRTISANDFLSSLGGTVERK